MVPKAWLHTRLVPEESAPDGDSGYETILQEHFRGQAGPVLGELLAALREGDEIWTYSSDADSWRNLAGRMG